LERGERSTLLHFKALRSVLAQASEQNACPEEQKANYEQGWTPFYSAPHVPRLILPFYFTSLPPHTYGAVKSKDKTLIKRRRRRMREREFPKADL